MSLEKTTELYASVLHQLLPEGVHDSAQQTLVADDIYAHAKVLAQSDIDAHRLLKVLEEVPLELLPDYEQEYGLPMLCAVPGSFSIEERLNVLKLVRTRRNVFNRTYLEQILAVFGVTLIDVVKFKPMQCIAPCNAPVNTERLRYKVFLRLQYPVNADIGCIIENYLPGYLRIEWMVDMPWGDWILNSGVTVNTNGIAHYTAYKTNQREYYDSYANLDLTAAIVRSLHDTDMQQWQAVKDAVNELTGVTDWTFDLANNRIIYTEPVILNKKCIDDSCDSYPYVWSRDVGLGQYPSQTGICLAVASMYSQTLKGIGTRNNSFACFTKKANGDSDWWAVAYVKNTHYDPNAVAPTSNISLTVIAQKIISNTASSNQAIALLAEAYLENVAISIFNTDPSKQFVKLSYLLSQFELNKTLRT